MQEHKLWVQYLEKKAYIILCRGIHEHKHMKLHTDMYDAYCSFACLHVLKQLKKHSIASFDIQERFRKENLRKIWTN